MTIPRPEENIERRAAFEIKFACTRTILNHQRILYQHLPHQTQDLVSAKPDRGTSTELNAKAQAQAQARARALQIAADPPCWNCGTRDDEGPGEGGEGRRATRMCAELRAVSRIG